MSTNDKYYMIDAFIESFSEAYAKKFGLGFADVYILSDLDSLIGITYVLEKASLLPELEIQRILDLEALKSLDEKNFIKLHTEKFNDLLVFASIYKEAFGDDSIARMPNFYGIDLSLKMAQHLLHYITQT